MENEHIELLRECQRVMRGIKMGAPIEIEYAEELFERINTLLNQQPQL